MFKIIKNNQGFTLMEMLMVMFIIALLLLLTIPNITKHKDSVNKTSCEAYADMAQTQGIAYEIAEGEDLTSIDQLVSNGYIPSATCDDGTPLVLSGKGEITVNTDE
ncbi:MAG: competence type IV pilus major pilin ComGC [Mycoplasmatales bacterium]